MLVCPKRRNTRKFVFQIPNRIGFGATTLIRGFAIVLFWSAGALPGYAQDDIPGRFEIRSARATLVDGVYLLDGRVEYRLPSAAREALRSGVPLRIELEIQVIRNRRFLLDSVEAELRQAYQLQYHAISERYIVLNENSGDQNTFATLFSALNFLGRLSELPIIDAALLEPGARYEVRIRAGLDTGGLPGPLRLLTFWRGDWSLESEWFRWQLPRE